MGVALAALLLAGCGIAEAPGRVTDGGSPGSGGASDGGGSVDGRPDGGGSDGGTAGGDDRATDNVPIRWAPTGTRCGEHAGWAVVVAQGATDCLTANSVISDYEDTPDVAPGGRPGNPESVQGWACEPINFAKMGYEPDTYSSWCQRDGVAIMTIDARTVLPVAGPIRKPDDFVIEGVGAKEVHWGFTSPSGAWYCGLVDNPSPEDGIPTGAHCYVLNSTGIPGTDVDQPGGGGTATAISIDGNEPAWVYYSGDWALHYVYGQTPLTLAYGEVLYARGGACTVDQAAGVTCTFGGHSFTASTVNGYTAT